MVTNIFPDRKISRPRLAIFAFAMQNKNIAAPSTSTEKSRAVWIFRLVDYGRIDWNLLAAELREWHKVMEYEKSLVS